MVNQLQGNRSTFERREVAAPANPYGWWFADCPRHGRTPHLDLFGGQCERCVAEERPAWEGRRTRQ